jgi:hypothetical protein
METEFDDEALTRAGEPVPVVGPHSIKFENADWREGYLDGLDAAANLGKDDGLVAFALGCVSGGFTVWLITLICRLFAK